MGSTALMKTWSNSVYCNIPLKFDIIQYDNMNTFSSNFVFILLYFTFCAALRYFNVNRNVYKTASNPALTTKVFARAARL